MKNILLIIGIILIFYALVSIAPYISDWTTLSQYGKGFMVGKGLLFLVGAVLIYFSRKKASVN